MAPICIAVTVSGLEAGFIAAKLQRFSLLKYLIDFGEKLELQQ